MPTYIYNKRVDEHGNHEVHSDLCTHKPDLANRENIGWFSNCADAISAIKLRTGKFNFDGCRYCCEECHKG